MIKILICILIMPLLVSCATSKKYDTATKEMIRISEKEKINRPMLHDIEIVNAETGNYYLEVNRGERIKIKAIPHTYDDKGNDISENIEHFSPTWDTDVGNIFPETNEGAIYIAPYSFKNPKGGGWLTGANITASQENIEREIIKSKALIRFKLAPDPTKE